MNYDYCKRCTNSLILTREDAEYNEQDEEEIVHFQQVFCKILHLEIRVYDPVIVKCNCFKKRGRR